MARVVGGDLLAGDSERRRGVALEEQVPLDAVLPPLQAGEKAPEITTHTSRAALHLSGNHRDLHADHRSADIEAFKRSYVER